MIPKILFSLLVFTLFYNGKVEAVKNTEENCNNNTNIILAEIFTAFKPDGSVDLSSIEEYAEYLIKIGRLNWWLFSVPGEPFSLNLSDRKKILNGWIDTIKQNNYNVKLFVGVGWMTPYDSCQLASYIDSRNMNIIVVYKPPSDGAATTPQQAVNDIDYVAQCCPNSSLAYFYNTFFLQCSRNPSIGEVIRLGQKQIPNLDMVIADVYNLQLIRAFVPYSSIKTVVIYYFSAIARECSDFDYHASIFDSIFVESLNDIFNAGSQNAELQAQQSYNQLAREFCSLRPDCRLPCPINIMKTLFEYISGISLGDTRRPLCHVTTQDRATVRSALVRLGYSIKKI